MPQQYIKVLTKPSAITFAEEKGKASWDIVWVQLLGYAILSSILGYLASIITPNRFNFSPNGASALSASITRALTTGFSVGSIITLPLLFFISVGILYITAKAFKGQGTFLEQSYTGLLFQAPLGILSSLLALVPIVGSLAAFALSIYSIILNIFSIMAVHRLSGGKATAVVFIPALIVFVLLCGLAIVIVGLIAATLRH